jgi:hypothetical protein
VQAQLHAFLTAVVRTLTVRTGSGGESAAEQICVLWLLVYAVDVRQLLRHLCIAGHMLYRNIVAVPNPVLVVCVVTQYTLVVFRCFGTVCRILPIPFAETSARNHQHTLRNSPEERRPQLHRGGRLKSCAFSRLSVFVGLLWLLVGCCCSSQDAIVSGVPSCSLVHKYQSLRGTCSFHVKG